VSWRGPLLSRLDEPCRGFAVAIGAETDGFGGVLVVASDPEEGAEPEESRLLPLGLTPECSFCCRWV